MKHIIERVGAGLAGDEDVALLRDVANGMLGKCLCALGDFSTMAVTSAIERFPEDFKSKVKV
jgi:NADH-quinone oxidoreductase subunit F